MWNHLLVVLLKNNNLFKKIQFILFIYFLLQTNPKATPQVEKNEETCCSRATMNEETISQKKKHMKNLWKL